MTATRPPGELGFATRGLGLHRAAVVGDAVGGLYRDTAAPSMHLVMTLRAVVSLLVAPRVVP